MRNLLTLLVASITLHASVEAAMPRAFVKAPVATPAIPMCKWNTPGANRFMGDHALAIDDYQDIRIEVRRVLKERINRKQYDEMVVIGRDGVGGGKYEPSITEMHFGDNKMCATVDRSLWKSDATELGMVFCEQGHCIIIPTVCGNVARIRKAPVKVEMPVVPRGTVGGNGFRVPNTLQAPSFLGWSTPATPVAHAAANGFPIVTVLPPTMFIPIPGPMFFGSPTKTLKPNSLTESSNNVPEPGSIFLVGLTVACLALTRRK